MLSMLVRMTLVTALYVLLTMMLCKRLNKRRPSLALKLLVGVIYGLCSILSTHFGVDYGDMMLNVRDLGPLAAGLFFDPLSGVLAGLIGGIERYIAGTYWGVGTYTRFACSVSTCLAGFVSAAMHLFIFKRKKPSAIYAFIMGAVMEVFHMYVVFLTHHSDMRMAFYVVRQCAPPMIFFTGLGLAACSVSLLVISGQWRNPFRRLREEEIPVSQRFQFWLFAVSVAILLLNFQFSYMIQTQQAMQSAKETLAVASQDIAAAADEAMGPDGDIGDLIRVIPMFHVGTGGSADLVESSGRVKAGSHAGHTLPGLSQYYVDVSAEEGLFEETLFGVRSLGRMDRLDDGLYLLTALPASEVYASRDAQAYEEALADILLFSVIYVLISLLVQQIVVNNLDLVNASLAKITGGDLNEIVSVRKSSEFASLSDDINQTVTVLKGYITAAEKRIEQELEFARTIQESSLPKSFTFPRREFELYAMMDPAREVGGDFYDFFFIDRDRLALVIADVSGKGIPAALFMMRAKTAIRGLAESGKAPAEALYLANNALCEGNDAEMFVTAWLGILDLTTGEMRCANAGHEYPAIRRAGGDYEFLKDRHGLALAAMEGVRYKEYALRLNAGDRLFVYTDGIPEAIDAQVAQYGGDRLLRALNAVKDRPMAQALPAVRQDIRGFVGDADQFDDITMLGLAYFGPDEGSERSEGTDD